MKIKICLKELGKKCFGINKKEDKDYLGKK